MHTAFGHPIALLGDWYSSVEVAVGPGGRGAVGAGRLGGEGALLGDPLSAASPITSLARFPPVRSAGNVACARPSVGILGVPLACVEQASRSAAVLPPSDSSELTAARCPDGAPAAMTGRPPPKAKCVGVLVRDCPSVGPEAAQGKVDRDLAGTVRHRGYVHRPGGLRGPAHNIWGHACCGRRGAGELAVLRWSSVRTPWRSDVHVRCLPLRGH